MSALARSLAIVAGLGVLGAAANAAPAAWPSLEMPAGARAEMVAADLVLNGKPCRVMRFEVAGSLDDVLQFYRTQFRATRAVETRVKDLPVIATRRDHHFHTVQLKSVGEAVHATVITTALRSEPLASAVSRDTEALMPPDTVVVSTLQSDDAGRRSLTMVGVNRHSIAANRTHLVALLQQRGFRLLRSDSGESASLALASASEEATLTIADAGPYRTVLVQRTTEGKP